MSPKQKLRISNHSCKKTEQCIDTLGSYHCRCAAGYIDNGLNTCVDDNECYSGAHLCDKNATCFNTEGSHECTCLDGYAMNDGVCLDEDECQTGNHNCAEVKMLLIL